MNRKFAALTALLLAAAVAVAAGEGDWFTRVKEKGLTEACKEDVARHEKGVLEDSLHVGECYYNIGRYEDGIDVFTGLLRSPDRNYAAAALVRVGEGQFHLGKKDEAMRTFSTCIEKHPDAWLDGSIPERCRAWLKKLAGNLTSPEVEAQKDPTSEIEALKREIRDLDARLKELRELLEKLAPNQPDK